MANPPVVFAGHNVYLLSVAKLCKDTGQFSDVTLKCSDGQVRVHRLIVGAASKFLKQLLLEHLEEEEPVVVLPEVKITVLAALMDFLYTGKMTLSRIHTRDLQLLVSSLGIDPVNVRVEVIVKNSVQFSTQVAPQVTKLTSASSPASEPVQKSLPVRAAKRKASGETDASSNKDLKVSSSPTVPTRISTTATSPTTPTSTSTVRGKTKTKPKPSFRPGVHDLARTETWVCAICRFYDPPAKEAGPTTEWIGCDCNRWYHKHCTGLKILDESFSCSNVKLKCLPSV